MNLQGHSQKTASRKNSTRCALAPGKNRVQVRAASGIWVRRRESRVGITCYPDHLGSPRAITRPSDNQVVWKWDNTEPFGNNAANENPSGLGQFVYNLRFGGMTYYDVETGTLQNTHRDLDTSTGRYRQSDPIGLDGGLNTYGYVMGNPLSYIDPFGLNPLALTIPGLSGGMGAGVIGGAGRDGGGASLMVPTPGKDGSGSGSSSGAGDAKDCCTFYVNVYEPNDGKHGSRARTQNGRKISAAPLNGPGALANSVPAGDSRIGYDYHSQEIVVFRSHRTDEKACKKYWHGYVVMVDELMPLQWRAGRDANFPNWPRKPK